MATHQVSKNIYIHNLSPFIVITSGNPRSTWHKRAQELSLNSVFPACPAH